MQHTDNTFGKLHNILKNLAKTSFIRNTDSTTGSNLSS